MSTSNDTARSGIYQIRNLANGKVYIGSTLDFKKRWRDHRRELRGGFHHSSRLQRAWNKYGEDRFVFEVVEVVHNKDDLVRVEQEWLAWLKPYDRRLGYNISPTAGSALGVRRTEEYKAKLSARLSGRKLSPEHVANAAAGLRGSRWSAERHAKMAEIQASPEYRAKMSEASSGRRHTPESLAKMSAVQKGRAVSEEHRAKLAEALRGRALSEEHKAKLREVRAQAAAADELGLAGQPGIPRRAGRPKGVNLSDEERAKISAATKARMVDPELRARLSEKAKARAATPEGRANLLKASAAARESNG